MERPGPILGRRAERVDPQPAQYTLGLSTVPRGRPLGGRINADDRRPDLLRDQAGGGCDSQVGVDGDDDTITVDRDEI